MVGLAQVGVLTSNLRQALCQFGIDECARQSDHAADDPSTENQRWRVDLLSDNVGINENARPNDAPHHQHGRVEESKTTRKLRLVRHLGPSSGHGYTRSGTAGEIWILTAFVPRTGCFALSVAVPGSCFARIQIAPPPPTRLNGFSPMISAGPSRISSIEAVE